MCKCVYRTLFSNGLLQAPLTAQANQPHTCVRLFVLYNICSSKSGPVTLAANRLTTLIYPRVHVGASLLKDVALVSWSRVREMCGLADSTRVPCHPCERSCQGLGTRLCDRQSSVACSQGGRSLVRSRLRLDRKLRQCILRERVDCAHWTP